MDNAYLSRLPADVRALVLEVESACGFEIGVEIDPGRARLGSHFNAISAAISIPDAHTFPASSVWHEVMHIRRILVDGVPSLEVGDGLLGNPAFARGLANLDNTIEHLYFVPTELQRFPERLDYWRGRVLDRLPALDGLMAAADKDSGVLILHALAVVGIGDADLISQVEVSVQKHSTAEKAARLIHDVQEALPDKAAVTKVFVREFALSEDAVELMYFDPRAGRTKLVPLFEAD